MPYASKAQHRFFRAAEARGDMPKGTASQWAHHTPNLKKLPERKDDAMPTKEAALGILIGVRLKSAGLLDGAAGVAAQVPQTPPGVQAGLDFMRDHPYLSGAAGVAGIGAAGAGLGLAGALPVSAYRGIAYGQPIGGVARGAVHGVGIGAGAGLGMLAGGVGGRALAETAGMGSDFGGNVGALAGGLIGAGLGHYGARKMVGPVIRDEEQPQHGR